MFMLDVLCNSGVMSVKTSGVVVLVHVEKNPTIQSQVIGISPTRK